MVIRLFGALLLVAVMHDNATRRAKAGLSEDCVHHSISRLIPVLLVAPFAALSVKLLVFRAAAAAADMLPGSRLSALINDVGTALGMLLGLVGCCGIMLFIAIMSGIKVVTA